MKCQILLSGKNKKKIISLSSAEFAHRMVKDKQLQVKVDLIRLDLMGDRPIIPHYNLALDKKIFFVTATVIFFFFFAPKHNIVGTHWEIPVITHKIMFWCKKSITIFILSVQKPQLITMLV